MLQDVLSIFNPLVLRGFCLSMFFDTDESRRTKQKSKYMKYKSEFDAFQKAYTIKYPASLKIRSYIPKLSGKSILDVGCGSGIDMEFFQKQGASKIAGCDLSKELVDIARKSNPMADIRNESFQYLSWKNYSFDVVYSKYALNCAQDIITPLKEISRVLKDSGTVVLEVTHPIRTLGLLDSRNYFDSGADIEYSTVDNQVFTEPHHTISDWINAISESGFKIIKTEEILNRPIKEYAGVITPSAILFILKKQ